MTEIKTNAIPHRLKNVNKQHPYVSGARDIYDDIKHKSQEHINAETDAALLAERTRAMASEELLRQAYEALSKTPPDIIPSDDWPVENPQEGIIYRVPNWDGTQVADKYTDYMWNSSWFVLMATYDNGIDTRPEHESRNLAESGGIFAAIHGYIPIDYKNSENSNIINTANKWVNKSSDAYGCILPIEPNTKFKIITFDKTAIIALLKSNGSTAGDTPDFCDSFNSRIVIPINSDYFFTTPDDARYIYMTKKSLTYGILNHVYGEYDSVTHFKTGEDIDEISIKDNIYTYEEKNNIPSTVAVSKLIGKNVNYTDTAITILNSMNSILFKMNEKGIVDLPEMGFTHQFTESPYDFVIVDDFNNLLLYKSNTEIKGLIPIESNQDKDAYERNESVLQIPIGVSCVPDHKRIQFMIITDTHTYPESYENAKFVANKLPACLATIHLGDINNQVGVNGLPEEYFSMLLSSSVIYPVIGNHDVGEYDRNIINIASNDFLYGQIIAPMIEKGWLLEGEYVSGQLYYYKDFSDYKVRLIVLNNFNGSETLQDNDYWEPTIYDSSYDMIENGQSYSIGDFVNIPYYTQYSFRCKADVTVSFSSGLTTPSIKEWRRCVWYKQEQLEWLCDTLKSAAENEYMCIIASHMCCVLPNLIDRGSPFSTQYGDEDVSSYTSRFTAENKGVIADIVKAFYNKESIEINITAVSTADDDASSEEPINMTYDFSDVVTPTKVTFIHGHKHRDTVAKNDNYPDQVCIGFTNSDITRSTRNNVGIFGTNKENDIFTTYTIMDKDHVHLCRIGKNVTDRVIDNKVVIKDNIIINI